jgi:hypothetical protein
VKEPPRDWSWPVVISSGCSGLALFLVILARAASETSMQFLVCFPLGMVMAWFALFGGIFALCFDQTRTALNLSLLIPGLLVAIALLAFTLYLSVNLSPLS